MSAPAGLLRSTAVQTAAELRLTSRRGENLLAVAIIPVVVLLFFASTSLIVTPGTTAVDFLLPGAIALAVIATGLVNLGIATAYERHYGVLKRLGGSPLGRPGLVAAKLVAVGAIVIGQTILLVLVATVVLGWAPGADVSPALLVAALVLGTAAFAGLGLLLAGTLRAEATLALANGAVHRDPAARRGHRAGLAPPRTARRRRDDPARGGAVGRAPDGAGVRDADRRTVARAGRLGRRDGRGHRPDLPLGLRPNADPAPSGERIHQIR